ncbi:uncharacterized protein LOC142572618 [Dermacentor variabilis]|uniref:uncharacterized protein LOC142572618 n=1 Tax=Dermacentor variabilis TaxID=34621 RepID=UPI003F5B066D
MSQLAASRGYKLVTPDDARTSRSTMKAATSILLGLVVLAALAYCHAEERADHEEHGYLARKRGDDDDQDAKSRKIAGEKSGSKTGGKVRAKDKQKYKKGNEGSEEE